MSEEKNEQSDVEKIEMLEKINQELEKQLATLRTSDAQMKTIILRMSHAIYGK